MKTRTLVLKRETLTALGTADLTRVAGGDTTGTHSDNLPDSLCQCGTTEITAALTAFTKEVTDRVTRITREVCDS